MSENEGGDGKVGAFLLGFLVGVLVCLGGGGVFFVMQSQRMAEMTMRARVEAERAEEEARRAEMERERAVRAMEAERKAREVKGK